MHQKLALHGKGHLVRPGRELAHFNRVGQLVQGNGERLVDNSIQDRFGALLAEDLQALRETELIQDMQALDMVQMEMAEKEVDRQIVMDVAVGPVYAVACVQDYVVFTGVDEGADGVAGIAIVPAVGAEKDDVHVSSPEGRKHAIPLASGGLLLLWGFRSARRSGELFVRNLSLEDVG